MSKMHLVTYHVENQTLPQVPKLQRGARFGSLAGSSSNVSACEQEHGPLGKPLS